MKKYVGLLAVGSIFCCFAMAQSTVNDCSATTNELHFNGKAPSPWATNGKVDDWETILGNINHNPEKPLQPPSSTQNNWFFDGNPTDLDHPDKKEDIELFAHTFDSYNVYFYLRLLHKSNDATTLYYFIDVNADGFMNTGEPVVSVAFDHKYVSSLKLSRFVPNTSIDYVAGSGNYIISPSIQPPATAAFLADGYTVKGSLATIFTAGYKLSGFKLNNGEVFDAAVTENGNGLELSVPWSFLKNWVTNTPHLNDQSIFLYHIALQDGCGAYNPKFVTDNAGQTREPNLNVGRVGSPKACVQTKSVQKLQGTTTYRFKIAMNNPTNVREDIGISRIEFSNIVGQNIDISAFVVNVYADLKCDGTLADKEQPNSFLYGAGSMAQPPLQYLSQTPLSTYQPTISGATSCFIIDVTLPANNSVSSVLVTIIPGVKMPIEAIHIGAGILGDGGKPINPIGFTLEEDFSSLTIQKTNSQVEKQSVISMQAFPNPGKGSLTILLPQNEGELNMQLLDGGGRIIKKWNNLKVQQLELQGLKRGMYILQATNSMGRQMVEKIIVQ